MPLQPTGQPPTTTHPVISMCTAMYGCNVTACTSDMRCMGPLMSLLQGLQSGNCKGQEMRCLGGLVANATQASGAMVGAALNSAGLCLMTCMASSVGLASVLPGYALLSNHEGLSAAVGTAVVHYSEPLRGFFMDVTVSQLQGGSITGVFLQGPALPGGQGPQVRDLTQLLDSGVAHLKTLLVGFTADQLDAVKRGLMYINVTTTGFPMGEVRGHVLLDGVGTVVLGAGGQSAPSNSMGVGTMGLQFLGNSSVFFDLTVQGLSGTITMAHFHGPAGFGEDAGPLFTIPINATTGRARGLWANLTTMQYAWLTGGRVYVNVHTTVSPGGEIRGQVGGLSTTLFGGTMLVERAVVVDRPRMSDTSVVVPQPGALDNTTSSNSSSRTSGSSGSSGTVTMKYVVGSRTVWYTVAVADRENSNLWTRNSTVSTLSLVVGNQMGQISLNSSRVLTSVNLSLGAYGSYTGTLTISANDTLTPMLLTQGGLGVVLNNGAGKIVGGMVSVRGVASGRLTGWQELPPVPTVGVGAAVGRLVNGINNTNLFFDMTLMDLEGSVTAVHFHWAAVPGNVGAMKTDMVNWFPAGPNRLQGVWTGLSAQQVDWLLSGQVYINVHTTKYPAGEVRGQLAVEASPAPLPRCLLQGSCAEPTSACQADAACQAGQLAVVALVRSMWCATGVEECVGLYRPTVGVSLNATAQAGASFDASLGCYLNCLFSTPNATMPPMVNFTTPAGSFNFTTPAGSFNFTTPAGSFNFTTPAGSSNFTTPAGSFNFTTPAGSFNFSTPSIVTGPTTTSAPRTGNATGQPPTTTHPVISMCTAMYGCNVTACTSDMRCMGPLMSLLQGLQSGNCKGQEMRCLGGLVANATQASGAMVGAALNSAGLCLMTCMASSVGLASVLPGYALLSNHEGLSAAVGTAVVHYSEPLRGFFMDVTVSQLQGGSITGVFLQGPALPGGQGPQVRDLTQLLDSGVAHLKTLLVGFTADQLDAVKRGLMYINVTTTGFPMGEVRGHVLLDGVGTVVLGAGGQSAPSNSMGVGTMGLQFLGNSSVFFDLTVQGLSGTITMAHFHGPAGFGEDAGPLFTIPINATTGRARGLWANLTTMQYAWLTGGRVYVNVHTTVSPGGEIRGQVGGLSTTLFGGTMLVERAVVVDRPRMSDTSVVVPQPGALDNTTSSNSSSRTSGSSGSSGTVTMKYVVGSRTVWYTVAVADRENSNLWTRNSTVSTLSLVVGNQMGQISLNSSRVLTSVNLSLGAYGSYTGTLTISANDTLTPMLLTQGGLGVVLNNGAGKIVGGMVSVRGVASGRLTGWQELPPVPTVGVGAAVGRLVNGINNTNLFFDMTLMDLEGSVTAVHFHWAAVPGNVGAMKTDMVNWFPAGPNRLQGVWTGLSAQQVDWLLSGQVYINVHTTKYPAGEVRGQLAVEASPAPLPRCLLQGSCAEPTSACQADAACQAGQLAVVALVRSMWCATGVEECVGLYRPTVGVSLNATAQAGASFDASLGCYLTCLFSTPNATMPPMTSSPRLDISTTVTGGPVVTTGSAVTSASSSPSSPTTVVSTTASSRPTSSSVGSTEPATSSRQGSTDTDTSTMGVTTVATSGAPTTAATTTGRTTASTETTTRAADTTGRPSDTTTRATDTTARATDTTARPSDTTTRATVPADTTTRAADTTARQTSAAATTTARQTSAAATTATSGNATSTSTTGSSSTSRTLTTTVTTTTRTTATTAPAASTVPVAPLPGLALVSTVIRLVGVPQSQANLTAIRSVIAQRVGVPLSQVYAQIVSNSRRDTETNVRVTIETAQQSANTVSNTLSNVLSSPTQLTAALQVRSCVCVCVCVCLCWGVCLAVYACSFAPGLVVDQLLLTFVQPAMSSLTSLSSTAPQVQQSRDSSSSSDSAFLSPSLSMIHLAPFHVCCWRPISPWHFRVRSGHFSHRQTR
jgi:hypothetical protein